MIYVPRFSLSNQPNVCLLEAKLYTEKKKRKRKEESTNQRKRRRSAGRRCTSCPSTVRHVSSPTLPSSAVILRVQELPLPTVATTTAVVSMAVAGGVVSIARREAAPRGRIDYSGLFISVVRGERSLKFLLVPQGSPRPERAGS